jgi:hypothetical protein
MSEGCSICDSALHTMGVSLSEFVATRRFVPFEMTMQGCMASRLVQLRGNPERFLPKIFEDDWAIPNSHPSPGVIRFLRIVLGPDGIYRLIGRQATKLFVYQFQELEDEPPIAVK